nr:PREDICTED: spindle and kinetochore-associated protein 1-like [Latimeria chalumnae]|eukprot:XP_014351193.1 PREDICTED: spindle and kinetochore-associated protein 1-like [Latimeria chalumnae]
MLSSDLEDISLHINNKISTIKTTLHLRSIGKDPALETVLKKIGKDMFALNDLINAFEVEVEHQASQLNSLKELEKSFEENLKEAKHLKENIPSHLPKKAALQKCKNKALKVDYRLEQTVPGKSTEHCLMEKLKIDSQAVD